MSRVYEKIFKNKNSDDIALIDSELNSISYSELYYSCINLAMILDKNKCSRMIILFTGNTVEFAIGLLASWMTDRTVILAEINSKVEDINFMLQYFESNTVICSPLTKNYEVQSKNKIFPKQLKEEQPDWKKKPFANNLALIIQTSGTTMKPKYVMLTHTGIVDQCVEIIKGYKKARTLLIVPITSIFGVCGLLLPNLYAGGSVSLYQGKFNISKVKRTVYNTKTTIIACTSSILELLTQIEEERYFNSVEYIVVAGEICNIRLLDNVKRTLKVKNVIQAYGLTETTGLVSGSCLDLEAPYESVGKIIKNFQIRIKINGKILDFNELGEIQVKGKGVTCGYYKNDELNQRAFDDGWFKGRIKNIIIVGGKNVYAEEVEELIMRNKNVLSAYVYAEKSDISGEKVMADIIFENGCSMTPAELFNYCKTVMKPYMIPKKFTIHNEYKVNISGKRSRSKCFKGSFQS